MRRISDSRRSSFSTTENARFSFMYTDSPRLNSPNTKKTPVMYSANAMLMTEVKRELKKDAEPDFL